MNGRTTFVIAHRLSTIKHADRIFVILDGKIVESGTYDELWKKQGSFAELLALQSEHLNDRKSGGKRSRTSSRNSKDAIRGKTAADKGDTLHVATPPGVRRRNKLDSRSRSRDKVGHHEHTGHDASHARHEEVSEPRGRRTVQDAVKAIHRRLSQPSASASRRQESSNPPGEQVPNNQQDCPEIMTLDNTKQPTSASSSPPKSLYAIGTNDPVTETKQTGINPIISAEHSKSMVSLSTSLQEHHRSRNLRPRFRSPKKWTKKEEGASASLPASPGSESRPVLEATATEDLDQSAESKESSPTREVGNIRKFGKFLRTRSRRATATAIGGIDFEDAAITPDADADDPKARENKQGEPLTHTMDDVTKPVNATRDHGVDDQSLIRRGERV